MEKCDDQTECDIILCILSYAGLHTRMFNDEIILDYDGAYMILHYDMVSDRDPEEQIGQIKIIDTTVIITDSTSDRLWSLDQEKPIYIVNRRSVTYNIDLIHPSSINEIMDALSSLLVKAGLKQTPELLNHKCNGGTNEGIQDRILQQ